MRLQLLVFTVVLLAAAPVEPEEVAKGTPELVRPATVNTSRATSPGRSVTVTVGQPLASGVLTGPDFEMTLGARLRRDASGERIFASSFEAGER